MQAAGEYHATNLRGESAGTHRSQESASLLARASLPTPRSPCGLSQGQIQTQGASGAACEPAFLISSQVMWAGAGGGDHSENH